MHRRISAIFAHFPVDLEDGFVGIRAPGRTLMNPVLFGDPAYYTINMCLFYLCLGAFVLGLANTVIYAAYSLSVYGKINGGADMGNHFNAAIFVLLLLGTLTCLIGIIKPGWKFAPLIPSLLFSAAFGYYINDRLIMIEEIINRIYGMMESGGNFGIVILVFVLDLVCVAALIVASFTDGGKDAESVGKAESVKAQN